MPAALSITLEKFSRIFVEVIGSPKEELTLFEIFDTLNEQGDDVSVVVEKAGFKVLEWLSGEGLQQQLIVMLRGNEKTSTLAPKWCGGDVTLTPDDNGITLHCKGEGVLFGNLRTGSILLEKPKDWQGQLALPCEKLLAFQGIGDDALQGAEQAGFKYVTITADAKDACVAFTADTQYRNIVRVTVDAKTSVMAHAEQLVCWSGNLRIAEARAADRRWLRLSGEGKVALVTF